MTSEEFRRLALSFPGATENQHMGHPDFRINGKIFATLRYPDESWGMVKLPPEDQNNFVQAHPKTFVPANGAWGRQGSTTVLLSAVDAETLGEAMRIACKQAAKPKSKPAKKSTRRR